MDIDLAGALNGVEIAREICALVDLPVVFITEYSDVILLEQAKRISPYGLLLKPIREKGPAHLRGAGFIQTQTRHFS